jgi:Peptidase S46
LRHAAERTKPDEARLREYTDANFPIQRQTLTSRAPVYPELEKLTLAFSLTKLREALGADDAFVRSVLGTRAPSSLAAELVDNTKLADAVLRRSLIDADEATIAANDDPMIAFVRKIDPDLRAQRRAYEDEVQAELTKSSGQIANAMFKINGTSTYPDATFTLRISLVPSRVIGRTAATSPRSRRSAAPSSAPPAATRFGCPTGGLRHTMRSIWRSRSISPPPTTSSAATPARR